MVERPVTAYDIYRQILQDNPEVSFVSTFNLIPTPHRKPGDPIPTHHPPDRRFYRPTEEFFAELQWWESTEPVESESLLGLMAIVGIGKTIIREEWFDVVNEGDGLGEWMLAGRCPRPKPEEHLIEFIYGPEEEAVLLFVDIEIPYLDETTEMIVEKISQMGIKGYLLRSDASYHFISDELSSLDELPSRYGRFINTMAGDEPCWEWVRKIGNALMEAKTRTEVKEIALYILYTVGHYRREGERWFWVDLRYIAHSLIEFPVLRVSGKIGYDNPPILIARFNGEGTD